MDTRRGRGPGGRKDCGKTGGNVEKRGTLVTPASRKEPQDVRMRKDQEQRWTSGNITASAPTPGCTAPGQTEHQLGGPRAAAGTSTIKPSTDQNACSPGCDARCTVFKAPKPRGAAAGCFPAALEPPPSREQQPRAVSEGMCWARKASARECL